MHANGEAPGQLVLQTLTRTDWKYTEVAALLEMTRNKRYRLRPRYGIERP